jgi:hypothetical protein
MNYILSVFFGVHKQTDPNIACSTMRNAPRISRPYQSFRSKAYWFQEICQRLCQNVYIYIYYKYQHMTQHSYIMSKYYFLYVSIYVRIFLRRWGSYRAKYMIFVFLTVMGQSSSMRHETNPPHVQSSVENWINARSRKITNRIGDFEKSNLFPAPNLSKIQPRRPRSGF